MTGITSRIIHSGLVAALAEGLDDLQALGELDLLLDRVLRAHPLAQLDRLLVHVDAAQELLDGLRAHRAAQADVLVTQLAVTVVRHSSWRFTSGQSPGSTTTNDSK
jgi:hypothetical protein